MDKTKQLTLTEEREITQEIPQEITEESRQELARFYDSLDPETREFIKAEEQDIVIVRAYADIVTGQKLAKIKARLPHGQWRNYLGLRWNASEVTAQRLMKVAESFKNVVATDLANYDPTALRLLAYAPESARLEAQERHDSGEHISAKLAKEIADRHKAELEATKKAAQQTITTLEEQIKALENERTRLRAEHNRAILTKQADDACIIRQQEFGEEKERQIEELTLQIEKLKAEAAQPQVIEKEIEKVVEVEVVKAPDDYEQLKAEVAALKENLQTSRQKAGEELSHYQQSVANLTKRLAQKEEALASFDMEQKQMKALRKLNESHHSFREAVNLLTSQHLSNPRLKETINAYLQDFIKDFNKFSEQVSTVNVDVMEIDYVESHTSKDT